MAKPTAKLRCAIYTRKSSEEGLEQDFNSLHAQREACEAYIKSQAGEGWIALETAYDDGGFSGGTMDRPGLKALMGDLEAGLIDVVVVYKVDRLTRALTDFSRIVEAFDRHGVSFVSVTQAFNTTTSMGRLTLNVLLSFAQFEREVTGERIRDKIAASKAKGMWMGGNTALGYDARERKLVVNAAEAATVRMLFERYLELGSVNALKAELDERGIIAKVRTASDGRQRGGGRFSRGALFHLLKNRLYRGEIVHRGVAHPGLHEAIVDAALFDAVQIGLAGRAAERSRRPAKTASALLSGKIFDHDGSPMTPTFAYGKGGRSYRYYVSAPLQQGGRNRDDGVVRRVSAPQLEALVTEKVACVARSTPGDQQSAVSAFLSRVDVLANAVQITVGSKIVGSRSTAAHLEDSRTRLAEGDALERLMTGEVQLSIPVRPVFRGGRTWLVRGGGRSAGQPTVDDNLVRLLRQAHAWLRDHEAWPSDSLDMLKGARAPKDSYVRKVIQLAFLAPDIQQAILDGRQPPGLTAQQIMDRPLPGAWADQRHALGFPC